jgi:hypothetical protein
VRKPGPAGNHKESGDGDDNAAAEEGTTKTSAEADPEHAQLILAFLDTCYSILLQE